MPYLLLNSYGVLDAKLESEQIVLEYAKQLGYEPVIVRPGRLVGEPFTNFDVAKLFGINQGSNRGVQIFADDVVNGDVERADVAIAVTKLMLANKLKRPRIFSMINAPGSAPTSDEWKKLLDI
jgi:nucleoside-diphosphate-sugar epimerase